MTNSTVILITHVVPYPPAAGNEIRILKLIAWLRGRGYKVILLLKAYSLDAVIKTALEAIVDEVYCLDEEPDDVVPVLTGRSKRVKLVFAKLRDVLLDSAAFIHLIRSPIEDEYQKKSSALKRSLCPDKLIRLTHYLTRQYSACAVIAEYIFTAPCLDVVPPGVLKLIDTIDMFSRKKEQVISHGVEDLLHCTPEEERDYLMKGDVIIAIQEYEAQMFRKLVPTRDVVTVGIDYDVVGSVDNSRVRDGLVLVVGSDNPLNVHGLQEFYRNAWGPVREKHPEAVLRVIGKLGKKFHTDDSSVEIAGWVESLDEEYSKACVVINPTVAGTGLKIKTVEALCKGKPLVGTLNSVEGLLFEGEPPFVVARDWEEFSKAISSLLKEGEKRKELQERALSFALEHFGAERVYAPLTRFFPKYSHESSNSTVAQVEE